MTYELRIDTEPSEFLDSLDSKSKRKIKDNLTNLEEETYPSPEAKSGGESNS